MGNDVPPRQVVLSEGAYKDGSAVLLSVLNEHGCVSPIVNADADLCQRLEKALVELGVSSTRSYGYTIGSFYFQPKSLMENLVLNKDLPGSNPVGHVEMEEASLFMVAERMGRKAGSLVVASDRYTVVDGVLQHSFEEDFDQDRAERLMLTVAAKALGVDLF